MKETANSSNARQKIFDGMGKAIDPLENLGQTNILTRADNV